ncbi:hypothetical protein ACP70R_006392 [Stipagrostis hirtigluma subsp. patula]
MLVIRDALQSQLQKDRLRQGIIEAELAKIDRAIALHSATGHGFSTGDVGPPKPVPYSTKDQFMPHRGFSGMVHDLKMGDGRQHGGAELNSGKPPMVYRVDEWSRPSCSTGKAGQENPGFDAQKPHVLNEIVRPRSPSSTWELKGVTIPVKKPKAPQKWRCTLCQVEATSERNLHEHFAGQKHQANVATLESRNNGTRHQATSEGLQGDSESMARSYVRQQPPFEWSIPSDGSNSDNLDSEMATHKKQLYFCKVCNEQCSDESMFVDHRRGEKHRRKLRKQKRMTFCKVCKLQCHSEESLASHLAGKKHQKNASLMGRS